MAAPQTPTLTLSFTLTLTLTLAHAQGRLRPDAAPQPVVGRSLSPPLAVSGVFLPSPRPGTGTSLNTPLASSPTASPTPGEEEPWMAAARAAGWVPPPRGRRRPRDE